MLIITQNARRALALARVLPAPTEDNGVNLDSMLTYLNKWGRPEGGDERWLVRLCAESFAGELDPRNFMVYWHRIKDETGLPHNVPEITGGLNYHERLGWSVNT